MNTKYLITHIQHMCDYAGHSHYSYLMVTVQCNLFSLIKVLLSHYLVE